MEREIRNLLERTTQQARGLLETEYAKQLEGIYDVLPDGTINAVPGKHLTTAEERFFRTRLVAAIEHRRAQGESNRESVSNFLRECAFTFLNRIFALRMLEARGIIKQSVSKSEDSTGFANEYLLLAPGLKGLPDKGYRLFLEALFDEIGREIGVLFDRNDLAGQLWPDRPQLLELLKLLNNPDLEAAWSADETIGWVYQYFNSDEERRGMRAESNAPSNSREMAVRNQFFTPRYVVEFLADNTIGRTWFEMLQGRTSFKESCRYMVRRQDEHFLQHGESPPPRAPHGDQTQEEMLSESVSVRYRAPKDPRDLRILDPACGSGHFLLYCFDLLETIYAEAWDAGIGSLRHDYPNKSLLLVSVPELILRHNLFGIDIDSRAAQIGSLALWMRAQRSWQGIPRGERPTVRKTNIVIAEPMPGEPDLLNEFCDRLEPKLLGQLVREVFDRMSIAGDAGALLRIETDIADTVEDAKQRWLAEESPTDRRGNPLLFATSNQRTIFEMERVTVDFWSYAEQRVFAALRNFVAAATSETGFRKRLFAEDAQQGLAFIDTCRHRFDVILMNPPFGDVSAPAKKYVDDSYGDTKGDVYKAFIEGAWSRLVPDGLLGIISSRNGFYLNMSQDWRERVVLRLFRPTTFADLGESVLDAMVETAAYTLRRIGQEEERALVLDLLPVVKDIHEEGGLAFTVPVFSRARGGLKRHQALQELEWLTRAGAISQIEGRQRKYAIITEVALSTLAASVSSYDPPLTCIRLLKLPDKAKHLLASVSELKLGGKRSAIVFVVHPETFKAVPGSPFAYWVDDHIRRLFATHPPFGTSERGAKVGLQTCDDFRFVRAWWEVPTDKLLKGEDDTTASQFLELTFKGKRWVPYSKGGKYSPYFSDVYLVVNWQNAGSEAKAWIVTIPGNSHYSRKLTNLDYCFRPGVMWTQRSQRGFSARPFPLGCAFGIKGPVAFWIGKPPHSALGIMNSRVFTSLLDLQMAFGAYDVGVIQRTPWPLHDDDEVLGQMADEQVSATRLLESLDELSHSFGIPALLRVSGATLSERIANWKGLQAGIEGELPQRQSRIDLRVAELYGVSPAKVRYPSPAQTDDDEDEDESASGHASDLVAQLVSYAIGCCFGRWDVRYATGESALPPLSQIYAPLPLQAPGSLTDAQARTEMLIDSPGHPKDLADQLERWFIYVFGPAGADVIREASIHLTGADQAMADWLRNKFFEHHLRQYSRKPRKAPLYWQLSIPSRQFSIWIHYHSLETDSLWRALNDFLKPKLMKEERRLAALRAEAGDVPSGNNRRAIQDLVAMVAELSRFRDDLETLASLWKPHLDDGVLINFSVLWRLVPHLPSWQRELREIWQDLLKGTYDWTNLAMHLWPERVLPKCAKDRSLAIAHGLERDFWEEQEDGRWKPRIVRGADLKGLIDGRTSKAVKAALEKLSSQPMTLPQGVSGRERARRNP